MSILCCFARPSSETRPGRTHPGDINNLNDSYNTNSNNNNNNNNNYISHPPPRYTPRPTTIHEKTLEAHLRDPPISSSDCPAIIDEKRRQELTSREREDVTSDVSSALSFQSSYGNTSTATRETPPPPYSPRHSQSMSIPMSRGQSPALSTRVSVSSAWSGVHTPTPTPAPTPGAAAGAGLTTPPMAHIAQPRSVPGGIRGRESWSVRSSFEERMRND